MNHKSEAPILANIAKQVKESRVKAKFSQEDLAALAGISRRPIYHLESGRGSIQLDSLIAILDALGLTIEIKPQTPTHD